MMNSDPLNPLLHLHHQADAELQPYADVQIVSTHGLMPAEYAAIHTACALMDLPHRGLIELSGRDRLSFLNNLLTCETWNKNTKSGLAAGQGVHGFLLNLKGRIMADVHVIQRADETWLVADQRLLPLLLQTLEKYLFSEQVKFQSAAGKLHQLMLLGPNAWPILRRAVAAEAGLPGSSTAELPESLPAQEHSIATRVFGRPVTLWRQDQTPQPGIVLICSSEDAAVIWSNFLATFGQADDHGRKALRPCGWAAYNACRIEAGFPIAGIDYDDTILPAETGQMSSAVSITKGCYLGQEIVARMHARNQVARQIVGLRVLEDAVPMAGEKVFNEQGHEVGIITSSTLSPRLSNAAIALALVKKPDFTVGRQVTVPAEGKMRPALVVPTPFLGDVLPLPGEVVRKPAADPAAATDAASHAKSPDPTNP